MSLDPPSWWYSGRPSVAATLLMPVAAIYGAAVERRFARAVPYRSRLPVICIGNFTMGGAGKTPLALFIAGLLRAEGMKPAFLTRGYGGKLRGQVWVDTATHGAGDVGDEPLLLARHGPVMVARDRSAGSKAIEASDADVIVMDDGFQNPSLAKDLSIVAVDGGAGSGNGRVFPAGPLRAPLAFQMSLADAVVVTGAGAPLPGFGVPLFHARIVPREAEWLRGARVVAFCGIGRPEKFFNTLRGAESEVMAAIPFPDHHPFTENDAAALLAAAERHNAILVTTEKDWVRIGDAGPLSRLRETARSLPIALEFAEKDRAALLHLAMRAVTRPERGAPPR